MKTIPLLFLVPALTALAILPSDARTWTATDGRKIEADFIGATGVAVTVKRSDGKTFDIPLDRLSEEDRKWIGEQAATPSTTAPAAGPAKPIEGPHANLITGDWALSKHGDLPYAFYGSKDLDASQKYPLVLALHGKSENDENGKQVGWAKKFVTEENYKERPCFVLAPLCYQPYGATGGGWSDKPGDEVIDLIKELMEGLPIDPDRVYIIGSSMGGFGTCHLMNKEPRLFAAGVPICGYGSDTGELKREPIWLFHAADDPVVGIQGSRDMAEALKRSKTFKFTEFPDGGHGIAGRVLDDPEVHQWLFAQRNG